MPLFGEVQMLLEDHLRVESGQITVDELLAERRYHKARERLSIASLLILIYTVVLIVCPLLSTERDWVLYFFIGPLPCLILGGGFLWRTWMDFKDARREYVTAILAFRK